MMIDTIMFFFSLFHHGVSGLTIYLALLIRISDNSMIWLCVGSVDCTVVVVCVKRRLTIEIHPYRNGDDKIRNENHQHHIKLDDENLENSLLFGRTGQLSMEQYRGTSPRTPPNSVQSAKSFSLPRSFDSASSAPPFEHQCISQPTICQVHFAGQCWLRAR